MTSRLIIDVHERRAFADDASFGDAGPYERLKGCVRFAVDPEAPAYRAVVDLDLATRGRDGLVEFASDLCILAPVDRARGNRRLLFGYGNRGNKRELQFFNDGAASNDPITAAHVGNGFLMRRGYTVVWAAWEGDLLPGDGRMVLDVPIARGPDGPITGLVRSEFIASAEGVTTLPLSGLASAWSYPTASLDPRESRLTRRRYPGDPREPVAPEAWCFARLEAGIGLDGQGGQTALVPSAEHIHLREGFRPGWIYELVYTARDPRVLGLGHVAVRDLVSLLRYGSEDAAGAPLPVGRIEKAYAWGRSQTGRAPRDFVHGGWNVDAAGRRVFDGVLSHVAGAGLLWMNHRFSRPVSYAGQEYEAHDNCADRFPFAYGESTDHLTGRRDAILKRPDTDPLVIHTQTASEYWQRRGSLVHTDTRGEDLEPPENARVYLWSSSQHFADPRLGTPTRGIAQSEVNVVWSSMLFRAVLDMLDRWASDGVAPPPSRIPRRADGTLVDAETWRARFPAIPGVATPRGPSGLPLLDFGPDFERGILAKEPPDVVGAAGYAVLVPAVDEDGNEIAGVRAPMVQAPLATYTGWALRARGFGHGAMLELAGSTFPFPETESERRATGDPRRSIEARYGDREGYVRAIEAAARRLVEDGFMLEEDVARCVAAAADWGAPRHRVTTL